MLFRTSHYSLPSFFSCFFHHPWLMYFSPIYFTRYSSDKRTSSLQNFPDVGMDHLMRSFSQKGLSDDVIAVLLKNVKEKSSQKYQGYWSRFYSWCIEREVNQSNLSVDYLCKFFNYLFDLGLSASTLKFARSSISFFLKESHPNITDHPYISRQIQAFEKIRPTVFRYVVTWDVKIDLDLFKFMVPSQHFIYEAFDPWSMHVNCRLKFRQSSDNSTH